MSNLINNVENDFDSFFNLDNDFTQVSASPATKPSLAHQSSSSSAFASQQSFVGPSYQYDSFRQQTGLPMGGLQNTFAINQASGLHYRPNQMGFVMPTETLNVPLANNLDDFDYTQHQSVDMADMDFDADSPSDVTNMFGQGESSQSAPIQRIYPGMHTQKAAQAAQAKAAQAQKQQELQKQRQQKQLAGQQPLPTQLPKAPTVKDPHVEETISNLLNQMRQRSTSSADAGSPDSGLEMGGLVRPKKEEDDMDEDERLLASEEGKKLTSKERRQLRNKVSARAFRSRRKEYITQLEAEVQQKNQEAVDLRVQNRQLMEENNRLTELTRMLLSSSSFSGFLQELSNSGMPVPPVAQAPAPQGNRSTSTRKDIGVHEAARQLQNQNQPTIGMAMVPETTLDVADGWNSLPSNDFQVFAITSIPRPAVLDMSTLIEKSVKNNSSVLSNVVPTPNAIPKSAVEGCQASDDLYYYATTDAAATTPQSALDLIASLRKPDAGSDIVRPQILHATCDTSAQLEQLCSEVNKACARMDKFMPPSQE